jgi:phage shock protein C
MTDETPNGPTPDRQSSQATNAAVIFGALLVFIGLWVLTDSVVDRFAIVRVVYDWVRWLTLPLGLVLAGVLIIIYSGRISMSVPTQERRLYRSRSSRMITGVAGGLADYFGVDPTLVRLLMVAFALIVTFWPAILAYIIATIVVPEAPIEPGDVVSPPPPPPQA